MKPSRPILMAVALAIVWQVRAGAQPAITLEIRETPLREALMQLFRQAGESLIIDASVQDNCKVSQQFMDAPFEQALRSLCDCAGLAWEKKNSVYVISPGPSARFWFGSALSSNRFAFQSVPSGSHSFKSTIRSGVSGPVRSSQSLGNIYRLDGTNRNTTALLSRLLDGHKSDLRSELPWESPFRNWQVYLPDQNVSRPVGFVLPQVDVYLTRQAVEHSTFSCPHCKKTVTVVGQKNLCSKCQRDFQRDWSFCPFDGTRRTSPLDDWKVCPFCARNVK